MPFPAVGVRYGPLAELAYLETTSTMFSAKTLKYLRIFFYASIFWMALGTLHLTALTRLGARMTAANVAFDDHPNDKRFSDRIETVTVDSVFVWLHRSGLGAAPISVR